TKGNFDGLVDFDAAVRDTQHPAKIKAEFDPGDHIHPNDAGNHAMADAFDLGVFKK
ncbi:MAG: SGNH/GDSL hydrolase family protein, partial [Acidobacteriota bacterium]